MIGLFSRQIERQAPYLPGAGDEIRTRLMVTPGYSRRPYQIGLLRAYGTDEWIRTTTLPPFEGGVSSVGLHRLIGTRSWTRTRTVNVLSVLTLALV